MIDQSLRDRLHDLTNEVGLVSIKSQEFSLIYGGDIKEIDSSTKVVLLQALGDIELYYNKTLTSLASMSLILAKTIAQKDWARAKEPIIGHLKDIYALLLDIKGMSKNISSTNYKEEILNIAKKMQGFIDITESINKVITEVREKLISLGIYDYVYDENGKVFIRILACDGDSAINGSIKHYFGGRGFIAYTAQTTEDALRTVRAKRPLAVFLDIRLAEGARVGLDVLKEIKECYPTTKVVMVTVLDADELKEVLEEAKLTADGYFTKPVDLTELVDKARELTVQK